MNSTNDTTTALILPFQYRGVDVRVHIDGQGKVWIAGRDITRALGYTDNNARSALRKIPAIHKGVHSFPTPGGVQNITCVDGPGLYRLVLRSDKPQAEPFIRWVTASVLPQIRLTGHYVQAGQPTLPADARKLVAAVLDEKIGPVRNALDELHLCWFSVNMNFALPK